MNRPLEHIVGDNVPSAILIADANGLRSGRHRPWIRRISALAGAESEANCENYVSKASHSFGITSKSTQPLSAGASVDHGVKVGITEEHVNRAADRGCCVSTCSAWISVSSYHGSPSQQASREPLLTASRQPARTGSPLWMVCRSRYWLESHSR